MKLRIATVSDLDGVNALVKAAYAPWVPVIGAIPGPMQDDYARAIAQGLVQVLEGPQGIAAILVLIPLPDALLLDNIAVAPEAQGQGHGLHLMRVAEKAARDMGYDILRLYTHAKMTANLDFYARLGFKPYRRVTEHGLPRVYMEKRLGLFDV